MYNRHHILDSFYSDGRFNKALDLFLLPLPGYVKTANRPTAKNIHRHLNAKTPFLNLVYPLYSNPVYIHI